MRRSLHLLCHAPHPSCHFGSSPACGIFGLPVSRSLIIFYLQSPLRSLPDDICIEIRCVRSKCQQSAHSGRRGDSVGNSFRHKDASRSEEHTSELQSLMRISYAVFCLKKKKDKTKKG